jgi:hypothetical protein
MDDRTDTGTDPRILMLIYAVSNYLEAKKEPVNPFVKGFGISERVAEADNLLQVCMNDCAEYFPEVNEMLEALRLDENTNLEESQTSN